MEATRFAGTFTYNETKPIEILLQTQLSKTTSPLLSPEFT